MHRRRVNGDVCLQLAPYGGAPPNEMVDVSIALATGSILEKQITLETTLQAPSYADYLLLAETEKFE